MKMRGAVFALSFGAALAAGSTALADRGGTADRVCDPKGSYWPGPGYEWVEFEGCYAGSWRDTATGSYTHADFVDNSGRRLDIAAIRHGHAARLVAFSVAARYRWSTRLLAHGGEVALYLDTDDDAAFERRVEIGVRNDRLEARIKDTRTAHTIGFARVSRRDNRTVAVSFPKRVLGARVSAYRWFAFAGIGCSRRYDACGDRAPDSGLLTHAL